jgi:hypothetical protein
MDKIERELGRPSSGNLSRQRQPSICKDWRDLRCRRPLKFIILSFEQYLNSRWSRVGGSKLSSGKDSMFPKSSLTMNSFRELSWNKPHFSLEAISFGHLHIWRMLRLEGKPFPGNDSTMKIGEQV